MYRVKIHYRTGDSFGSKDRTQFLDGDWKDISIIEENLKRIKLHWEWYDAKENKSWCNPKKEEIKVLQYNIVIEDLGNKIKDTSLIRSNLIKDIADNYIEKNPPELKELCDDFEDLKQIFKSNYY